MLSVGDRFETAIPKKRYLLIVTKASAERRRRLVRIMTCENGDTFVYSGSPISMCAEKGEISRMMGHRRILALGHDEVNRRRERGGKGPSLHTLKISVLGARSFFFPMTRLSLNQAAGL